MRERERERKMRSKGVGTCRSVERKEVKEAGFWGSKTQINFSHSPNLTVEIISSYQIKG